MTGGIGSGKSAVSARLASHGALVIDADALAREVVEPGTPGLTAVEAEFGTGVINADGSLDRPAMAAIVFADPDRRRALEAIVHPLVAQRSATLVAAAPDDAVVVSDIPILAEMIASGARDRTEFDLVVVVTCPHGTRLDRLVARGVPREDALARIGAQFCDEQRLEYADVVIDNSGSLGDLDAAVDDLWERLTS